MDARNSCTRKVANWPVCGSFARIFTQADISRFDAFRLRHDDAIKAQQFQPAFDVFATYQRRVAERVAYARSLLAKPFDFSTDETWLYDREDRARQ